VIALKNRGLSETVPHPPVVELPLVEGFEFYIAILPPGEFIRRSEEVRCLAHRHVDGEVRDASSPY
jgi:hypothetical protein